MGEVGLQLEIALPTGEDEVRGRIQAPDSNGSSMCICKSCPIYEAEEEDSLNTLQNMRQTTGGRINPAMLKIS